MKHMELGHQLVTFAITSFGVILGLKFFEGASTQVTGQGTGSLILIYPVLALFLSIGWYHCDVRSRQIGDYIKKEIEEPQVQLEVKKNNIGWEHYLENMKRNRLYISLWNRGIFISTEALAIILGLVRPSPTSFIGSIGGINISLASALVAFAIICCVGTILVLFGEYFKIPFEKFFA